LDPNPLVGDGVAPRMAHASTSRATQPSSTSTGTTIATTFANVNEDAESEESKDFEPENDLATHVENPISSSGDEIDD